MSPQEKLKNLIEVWLPTGIHTWFVESQIILLQKKEKFEEDIRRQGGGAGLSAELDRITADILKCQEEISKVPSFYKSNCTVHHVGTIQYSSFVCQSVSMGYLHDQWNCRSENWSICYSKHLSSWDMGWLTHLEGLSYKITFSDHDRLPSSLGSAHML